MAERKKQDGYARPPTQAELDDPDYWLSARSYRKPGPGRPPTPTRAEQARTRAVAERREAKRQREAAQGAREAAAGRTRTQLRRGPETIAMENFLALPEKEKREMATNRVGNPGQKHVRERRRQREERTRELETGGPNGRPQVFAPFAPKPKPKPAVRPEPGQIGNPGQTTVRRERTLRPGIEAPAARIAPVPVPKPASTDKPSAKPARKKGESAFEKAFRTARENERWDGKPAGSSTFTFGGKTYSTARADDPPKKKKRA
jgi:hypothetical protein